MFEIPKILPCFPCPHRSKCCRWGTYLSEKEAWDLSEEFGRNFVYWDADDKEHRTQVKDGRCAFYDKKLGGCTIHDHPHFPQACHLFPHRDGRDVSLAPAADATLCPEVKPTA